MWEHLFTVSGSKRPRSGVVVISGAERRVLFFPSPLSPSTGRRRVLEQRGELLVSAGVANISEVQQRQRAKPQPRPGTGGQMECELWGRGKRGGGGSGAGGGGVIMRRLTSPKAPSAGCLFGRTGCLTAHAVDGILMFKSNDSLPPPCLFS